QSPLLVLGALERDVVAEPFGLLVGVRMAADVHEQRRVVDDNALTVTEADPLGQPQRDQALPEDVLHRLPEAKVDAQRKRRDQFGQAHPRAAVQPPTHHHLMIQAIWPLTRCFYRILTPVRPRPDPAWAHASSAARTPSGPLPVSRWGRRSRSRAGCPR